MIAGYETKYYSLIFKTISHIILLTRLPYFEDGRRHIGSLERRNRGGSITIPAAKSGRTWTCTVGSLYWRSTKHYRMDRRVDQIGRRRIPSIVYSGYTSHIFQEIKWNWKGCNVGDSRGLSYWKQQEDIQDHVESMGKINQSIPQIKRIGKRLPYLWSSQQYQDLSLEGLGFCQTISSCILVESCADRNWRHTGLQLQCR